MKTIAFLDQINNGYALLLYGEKETEQMDIHLETLAKYVSEPVKEGDVLEITLSDGNGVIYACKLVEETERRYKEIKAILDWMMYGISGEAFVISVPNNNMSKQFGGRIPAPLHSLNN